MVRRPEDVIPEGPPKASEGQARHNAGDRQRTEEQAEDKEKAVRPGEWQICESQVHLLWGMPLRIQQMDRGEVSRMDDYISRQAAIMDAESWVAADEYEKNLQKEVVEWLKEFPPAELGTDTIIRQAAIDVFYELWGTSLTRTVDAIKQLPPAQTEQHIDADGTLWITVTDIEQVKRVIVDEDKSKFCRQFYLEEEQRTGKWIPQDHNKRVGNISTCVYYYPICSKCGKVGIETYKFCPHCGAKMTEGDAE